MVRKAKNALLHPRVHSVSIPSMYACILQLNLLIYDSLTSSHNGDYLAEQTALCLRRYGLEKKGKVILERHWHFTT